MSDSVRRPGDRIIRRRMRPTRIIELPTPEPPVRPPSTIVNARLFVLAFTIIVLVGAGLLTLPWVTRSGVGTPPQDALFTAMSAISVTGLETRDTATHWNWFGQFVILLLIQIGGLGFMVGASLVLRILGRGDPRLRHQLMIQDNIPTLSLRDAMQLVGKIVRFTLITEAIGAFALTLRFMQDMPIHVALWHGIFHAISAFCNAGFDLQGNFDSLTGYRDSIWMNATFILLIQAGALSYIALSDVINVRRWNALAINTRIVLATNAILVVLGALAFLIAEWNGAMADSSPWSRPMQAVFQSVSARTAGFATVDFSTVSTFSDFFWVAIMYVGGASGSTAGGIKLTTIAIILIAVTSEINGHVHPQIFKRRLPLTLVVRALTVATLFFLIHFTMTLALAATEHAYGQNPSFVSMMFETMSAQATVGLSTGITPELSTPGKLVLILTMFIGRIGPLTLAYALQQRERRRRYRFPEATVHIG